MMEAAAVPEGVHHGVIASPIQATAADRSRKTRRMWHICRT